MGGTRHVIGITEAADIHIDGSARLICVWVMDKKGLKLIWESNQSIRPVVKFWGLQILGDTFYGLHGRKA